MVRPRLGESERRIVASSSQSGGRARDQSSLCGHQPGHARFGVRVTAAEATELRELNRIGVNLNQMARALNSGAVS